jgi:hypothetical protein
MRIDSPFAHYAARLLAGGYSPVPLYGKRPVFGKWDRLRSSALTPAEIEELCRTYGTMNLGAAGGFNGLAPIDVDTDDREIMLAVVKALPPVTVAKAGRKGFTAFYRDNAGMIEGQKFKRPLPGGGYDMLVEVLVTGQTVLPPSIHPGIGKPYVWKSRATLFNTGIDDLPEITPNHIKALKKALSPWMPRLKPFIPGIAADNTPKASGTRMEAYANTILANEVREISALSSGRNWALYAAGAKLGKYVHAGHLSAAKVMSGLMAASGANGYSQAKHGGKKQAQATIGSGLKKACGDALPALGNRQRRVGS